LPDQYRRFDYSINEDTADFEDKLQFSSKIPDLLVRYYNDDGRDSESRIIFIAEVGFSETYEDLKRSMKLWLEGSQDVKMAFLVKFTEKPQYRSPKSTQNLLKAMLKDAHLPVSEIRPEIGYHQDPNDKDGSLWIHGHKFVGKMSAYLEIWRHDPESGVIRQGQPIVSIFSQLVWERTFMNIL